MQDLKLTGYKIDIKSESQAEEMGYFSDDDNDERCDEETAYDNEDAYEETEPVYDDAVSEETAPEEE